MSDLDQSPATSTEGQTVAAPGMEGTTAPAPGPGTGQAETQGSSTEGQAESTQAVDNFFDPSQLPPELKSIHKQMQAAYTKKTQALAEHRQKIEAYDGFMADPVGSLQKVAAQYGMTLTRTEAKAAIQQAQNNQGQPAGQQPWEPQTWDEVLSKAEERATQKILSQLAPMLQNVQEMKANSIEKQLAQIDPNWKIYEDDMRETLRRHPSMISDVNLLYRMSVPEEVYSSRAVQGALLKLQSKTNQAQVGSKSSTSRTAPAPKVAKTFSEAVEIAKQQLAEQGR